MMYVQWYRFIKDISTTERIPNAGGGDFIIVPIPIQNEFTTTLNLQCKKILYSLDTTGLDHHLMMSAMYLSLLEQVSTCIHTMDRCAYMYCDWICQLPHIIISI